MPGDQTDDVVRRGLAAWLAGEVDELAGLFDENVTLRSYEPGPWDCTGRRQVTELLRQRRSRRAPGRIRVEQIDERTLVASSAGSAGADPVATRITLAGGKVVAMQQYRSWADALDAGDS